MRFSLGRRHLSFPSCWVLLAFVCGLLPFAYAEDNTLTTIDGITSNAPGSFVVGSTGTNNSLIVTNAGVLNIPGSPYNLTIGDAATADNNFATVTGSNSLLNVGYVTVIGSSGAGNQLAVANSGQVFNAYVHIGNLAGSDHNRLVATDPGSVLTATGYVYVGSSGFGNSLVISNGAQGVIGKIFAAANAASSSNNMILVTDAGSRVNITGSAGDSSIYLGYYYGSRGNSLTVANGGTLTNATGTTYVGYLDDGRDRLAVTNGGQMVGYIVSLGENASSINNTGLVTGSGSLLRANYILNVGSGGAGNQFTIANSGQVFSTYSHLNSANNQMIVTDPGSVFTSSNYVYVGYNGGGNSLVISNGAQGVIGRIFVGVNSAASSNNTILVTDPGSHLDIIGASGDSSIYLGWNSGTRGNSLTVANGGALTNATGTTYVGYGNGSGGNQLIVTNGGSYRSAVTWLGYGTGNNNNSALVSGTGTVFNGGSVVVGNATSGNTLTISNGATAIGTYLTINGGSGGNNNRVVITDPGTFVTNSGYFYVGSYGTGGNLTISNGARVVSGGGFVGVQNAAAQGNSVLITGPGSTWEVNTGGAGYYLYVGYFGTNNNITVANGGQLLLTTTLRMSDQASANNNSILVTNGGLVEANTISFNASTANNTISNIGGIYQFTQTTPSITLGASGRMVVTNGTISFRGITTAPLASVANINYNGDNTYRLNNATNATGLPSYRFDSVANTGNSSNYQSLVMINNAGWRSGALAIGSGGSMLVSNTTSSIAAAFSATGQVSVVNSKLTFVSNVVIAGSYVSDPSTNTFMADLTVTPSGTLAGGVGDLFDFKKSFLIQATNNQAFQLQTSSVQFSGGGMHTNEITGLDLGNGPTAYDAAFTLGTNFAYGELHLGSASDQICFTCQNVAPSNALYAGWLDLLGSTNYVANLHASNNITIYYALDDTRNGYLGNQTYQLTQCDGVTLGGILMPVIPEPSALLLAASTAILLSRWKRNRK